MPSSVFSTRSNKQWGSPVGGKREVARRRRPATEEGRGRGAPENKIKTREGPFRPFLIRGRASARDTAQAHVWCACVGRRRQLCILAATAAVGGTGGTKRAAPAVLDFSLPNGYSLQLDWHL